MKKILGLDIGTTSIGWAIVEATEEKKINEKTGETAKSDINNKRIGIHKDAVGVRIIPQNSDNIKSFTEGKKLNVGKTKTPTENRRQKRGSRRMNNRYKMRREKLIHVLKYLEMLPDGANFKMKNDDGTWTEIRTNSNLYTNKKGERGKNNDIGRTLYKLRDKALIEEITLQEWGRTILHLNQQRGYSSDRFKKDETEKFDYLSGIVTYVSEKPLLIKYDDETESSEIIPEKKDNIIWQKYAVTIKFDEPIKETDEDDNEISTELINGNVYTRELKFLKDSPVTFRYKTYKKETKIEYVNPNSNDWRSRYKLLNQTLDEWCTNGGTPGSYFYQKFYVEKSVNFDRIRNNVVNRDWFENEFDKIFDIQFEQHKSHFDNIVIEDVFAVAFKDERILNEVKKKYGLKEQLRFLIKDKIIYYQRPWQQSKNKGECRFEKIPNIKKKNDGNVIPWPDGKKHFKGRTVIPRSHPLFQKFKIWQQINNVRLWYHPINKKPYELMSNSGLCLELLEKYPHEIKELLYLKLQENKEVSWRTFVNKTFNLDLRINRDEKKKPNKDDAFYSVNFIKITKNRKEQDNKLKGNTTLISVKEILKNAVNEEWYHALHIETGITNLELLWQLIYDISISSSNNIAKLIREKHFPELNEYSEILAKIQFSDSGMGSLSARAIRNILPLMNNGMDTTDKTKAKINSLISLNSSEEEKDKPEEEKLSCIRDFVSDKNARIKLSHFKSSDNFKYLNYWEAVAVVYGSHSSKKIKQVDKLERVKSHSMNNPIVEKIVNETLMLVNELKHKYGFDETRIELSRELKSSIDEREQMWEAMKNNREKIERAKAMLRELTKEDTKNKLNLDTNNNNNLDKIKIIEDVVSKLKGKEHEEKKKEFKVDEPSKAELTKYLHYLEQNFRCPYTNQPISLSEVFSKHKKVELEHIIPKERYYDNSYSNKVITWTEINSLKGNRTAYEFIVSKREKDNVNLANGKTVNLVANDKWEQHIKEMFPKGRKQRNLLLKEISEDPIERQLKETQYINKKLKEELENICPERVWTTTGKVTDILRERWHLNDLMKDLMRERFDKFEISVAKGKTETFSLIQPERVDKETGEITPEKFEGYSKRLDHRHHALDAIIIACTKQFHIQYLNLLNQINSADQESDDEKKNKYNEIKEDVCVGNSSTKFNTPWDKEDFIPKVKEALENVVISHKNVRLLISPSKHRNGKLPYNQKVASIRGELHTETNYAKRNYYQGEKGKTDINNIIKELLIRKYDNQNQTMIGKRSFTILIKEYIFKEKYQKEVIPVFEMFDNLILNVKIEKKTDENSISILQKKILKHIEERKILFNHKENKPLEWLTVFAKKNASARPLGLEMNLNDAKILNDKTGISDPRIKRLASYRLNYINKKLEKVNAEKLDKKESDAKKSVIKATKLYSNSIYEVRIKKGENEFEWIELNNFTTNMFDKIKYAKPKTTNAVKEILKQIWKERNNSFGDYFANPIFLSKTPIPIKKVRQLAWVSDLFEIKPRKYVNASDTFMAYIFMPKKGNGEIENLVEELKFAKKSNDSKKLHEIVKKLDIFGYKVIEKNDKVNIVITREIKILKFLEAVNIINLLKPNKIKYSELINNPDINKYDLAFTIAKSDLVYLPDRALSQEEIRAIDWKNFKEISNHLHIVKDINPSQPQSYFMFQKHTQSDEITFNETDAKNIFNNPELKAQTETEKYGNAFYRDNCIKVFTDKLGKIVVPYWVFPNGCWDKKKAKELGLITNDD